ncbi:MAG: TauD/TfdA dioxygenase family protein [Gemmatimonas sp.]
MATRMTARSRIEVRPSGGALGAEIVGVDLSKPMDDQTFAAVHAAWLQNLVICFRNQEIDSKAQIAYGSRFGELSRIHTPEFAGEDPAIMYISNQQKDGKFIHALPVGEMQFHIDQVYTERPAKATILYSLKIPKTGGDTLFANLYRAYDLLPDDIKKKIAGKKVLHVYDYDNASVTASRNVAPDAPRYAHPIVRIHPETRRKALFVNRLMTYQIEGMDEKESAEILEVCYQTIERADNVYAHKWQLGDVLMWDNRCTAHARTDFEATEPRLMRRLTVLGERPE